MEVHHLAAGEHAPEDCDHVTINILRSGKSGFTGVRKMGNVNSHTVSPNSFDSEDEAVAAALIWAEENDVKILYVERPSS